MLKSSDLPPSGVAQRRSRLPLGAQDVLLRFNRLSVLFISVTNRYDFAGYDAKVLLSVDCALQLL